MHAGVAVPPALSRWAAASVITEFPLEWTAIAVLGIIELGWAALTGFSLTVGLRDWIAVLGILAVAMAFRTIYRDRRGSLIAEFFALCLLSTAAIAMLSYLCFALAFPLADPGLLRLDRLMGLDWLQWFRYAEAHPPLLSAARVLYASIMAQGIFFLVLFGLAGDRQRLRETFWIILMAGVVACLVSAVLPALGTFEVFKLGDLGGYLGDMKRLRSGETHFNVEYLTGIVSFPSFHTSLAVIYVYAFRKTGPIGVIVAIANCLMLPAIPLIGGHYFVDMLAGALVGVAAIAIVRHLMAGAETQSDAIDQTGECDANGAFDVAAAR